MNVQLHKALPFVARLHDFAIPADADTKEPRPYSSLNALRQDNDELLASIDQLEQDTDANECLGSDARIIEFVRDAVATGATLDLPHERKIAQALIDYWVATAYETRTPFLSRTECLLLPYDARFVRSLAEAADEVLDALPRTDGPLVRSVLLGLIGGGFSGNVRSLQDDRIRAAAILEKLQNAGVVSGTRSSSPDHVELRCEVLIRQWERLRTLSAQRFNFRNAAQHWIRSGRDRRALVNGPIANEAAAYIDLSKQEREFLLASRTRARVRYAVSALLIVIPVAVSGIFFVLAAGSVTP